MRKVGRERRAAAAMAAACAWVTATALFASSNDVEISLLRRTATGTEVRLVGPESSGSRWEIFSLSNANLGAGSPWTLQATNVVIPPAGTTSWWDGAGGQVRFYVAGSVDADHDRDEVSDAREFLLHRTRPDSADSDGDGMPDGWELGQGHDPRARDGVDDPDRDGYPNLFEYVAASDSLAATSVPPDQVVTVWAGTNCQGIVPNLAPTGLPTSMVFTQVPPPGSTADVGELVVLVGTPEPDERWTRRPYYLLVAESNPPVIVAPANVVVSNLAAVPPPAPGAVEAEDDCGGVVVDHAGDDYQSGSGCASDPIVVRRTYRATDDWGNRSWCTQTITVADGQSLLIEPPPDRQLDIGASLDPTNTGLPSVWVNCCEDIFFSHADAETGTCVRVLTRLWTATSTCHGIAVVTQRVTVADRMAPTFVAMPSNGAVHCQDPVPGPSPMMAVDDQPQQPGGAGMVLEFPFDDVTDGVTPDTSIYRREGMVSGAVTDAPGRHASCLLFDGVDDVVQVPSATLSLTSFTVTAWIKTDDAGPDRRRILTRAGSGYAWWMALDYNRLHFGASPYGPFLTVGVQLNDQSWHMVAVVQDHPGRATRFYVDGLEVHSEPLGPTPPPGPVGPDLGILLGDAPSGGEAFAGRLDDVRLFARALSLGELNAVMQDVALDRIAAVTFSEQLPPATGTCGTVVRTWTARDLCGNEATVTQSIEIVDVLPPVLQGVPAHLELDAPDVLPYTAVVTASDNCAIGVDVLRGEQRTGSSSVVVSRIWRAADDCGNVAIATQVITVLNADLDADGMGDFWERGWARSATGDLWESAADVQPGADADGDGLDNLTEYELGTSPLDADTDRDWMSDSHEIAQGANPLDVESTPVFAVEINDGSAYATQALLGITCSAGMVADAITIGERALAVDGVVYPFANDVVYALADVSNGWRRVAVRVHREGTPQDLFADAWILFDSEPPALSIATPVEGLVTDRSWLRVAGEVADAGGLDGVTINGRPASGRDGAEFWQNRVFLAEGTNHIVVCARDLVGHITTSSVAVIRDTSSDTNAPRVQLDLPQDYEVVDGRTNWMPRATYGNSPELFVGGSCDDETALVRILAAAGYATNGPYNVQMQGTNLLCHVPLFSGTNRIEITAADAAGHVSTARYDVVRRDDLVFAITNPAPFEVMGGTAVVVRGRASVALRGARIVINGVEADVEDLGSHLEFQTESALPLSGGYNLFRGVAELGGRSIYCDPPATRSLIESWWFRTRNAGDVIFDYCPAPAGHEGDGDTMERWDAASQRWTQDQVGRIRNIGSIEYIVTNRHTELKISEAPGGLLFGEHWAVEPYESFSDPLKCSLQAGGSAREIHDGGMVVVVHGEGAPVQNVVLEFEGMHYLPASDPPRREDIFFRGQRGTVTSNGVQFVLPLTLGYPFTITGEDFDWPGTTESRESWHVLSVGRLKVRFLDDGAVGDMNRDGRIDLADRLAASQGAVLASDGDPEQAPSDDTNKVTYLRLWVNDDADNGEISVGLSDTPGAQVGLLELDGRTPNYHDVRVNGYSDLVDFFPVYLNIAPYLDALPGPGTRFVLKQEDETLNVVFTALTPERAGSFQTEAYTNGFGDALSEAPQGARTYKVTREGLEIPAEFVENVKTNNGGVILVEGRLPVTGISTSQLPLILEVRHYGVPVSTVEMPMQMTSVEEFYDWVSVRQAVGDTDYVRSTDTTPDNFPQHTWNGKYFVFVHGYNVNEQAGRSWNAEVFKRLWQTGMRSRFVGTTWYGDESQISIQSLNKNMTPDYWGNVYNAFKSSKAFNIALEHIRGKPVVLAGHSLGNMAVSSLIADWDFPAEQYFMIDAAVAVESYDPETRNIESMRNPYWEPYQDRGSTNQYRLWSTHWHELFSEQDGRHGLTWLDRFGVLTNNVNFYSWSEDVLGTNHNRTFPGVNGNGRGAWVQQEMIKGSVMISLATGRPRQGGWGFNDGIWPVVPGTNDAFSIESDELKQNPFFKPLRGEALYGDQGSETARDYTDRSRWLAEGIPSLSHPAGSSLLSQEPSERDVSMPDLVSEMDWPVERGRSWLHSDVRDVAYFSNYPIYQEFLRRGGL